VKKNLRNMALIGLTIGTLTLGSSFSVSAAGTDTTSSKSAVKTSQNGKGNRGQDKNRGNDKGQRGKIDTASLVTSGVIDQTTADAITAYQATQETAQKAEMEKVKAMTDTEKKAYFESKKSETKTSLLDQLVSESIITQTQADAIKAAQPQKDDNNENRGQRGKIDTASLVTSGVIDQTTADAITAYQATQATTQKAEMEKVKAMTDTERETYFESKKSETKTSLLDQLVSGSIITQTQANAIKAAQPQKNDNDENRGQRGKIDTASLVTSGVIDQTTADAITAYQATQETTQKAEMEKVKAMTDTEREAYFESKKSETKTSLLDQLVSESIITQTQADAIKAAFTRNSDK